MELEACQDMALDLVRKLIRIPSVSREEKQAADLLEVVLHQNGLTVNRRFHNVWTVYMVSENKPTILLNSHLDTVKPVAGWKKDPFAAEVDGDRIYGLGSNDAGGALVSLLACFLYYNGHPELPFNLVFAATSEEEVSGEKGVTSILDNLGRIDLGIVGEPTGNQMAVAEKGLMVVDGKGLGSSAHAATGEGVNAIYQAMKDIEWISGYRFEQASKWLGQVSMQVTVIHSGTQHNVVPDQCEWVADVRTNEHYSNQAVFDTIRKNVQGEVKARSFRLNPSFIPEDHPVVRRGHKLGLKSFGSMTLSDQALMSFPTLKIGPGVSNRSHTADEYICKSEIRQGIIQYIQLLEGLQI